MTNAKNIPKHLQPNKIDFIKKSYLSYLSLGTRSNISDVITIVSTGLPSIVILFFLIVFLHLLLNKNIYFLIDMFVQKK